MTRKTAILVALAAAVGAAIGVVVAGSAPARQQPAGGPDDAVIQRSSQSPGEVAEYWTPERRRDATGG